MRSLLTASLLLITCALPLAVQKAAAQTSTATPADVEIGSPIALTFYVALKHGDAAEDAAQAIQTPGSGSFHKFLTVPQFVAQYSASDAQIKNIENSLVNMGYTIGYVYPNHLAIEVTATVGTAQNTLNIKLKKATYRGHTGFAPNKPPTIPAELADSIRAVGGLNTMTHPHPMHKVAAIDQLATGQSVGNALTGGIPGAYLPADFESFYDVNPLYKAGFSGRGTTVGIVTLNTFDAADAYLFWKSIGLTVSQTRITKVDVDGGTTATSNNSDGEGETDLDVEYSGAIAPNASVRVYIAPNLSDANFINGFMAAASENIADTLSTSWGQPELDYFYDVASQTPASTDILKVYHDAFLEMALQGQTLYAATGDSGSFDTVRGCPAFGTPTADAPVCNSPYAVDTPASDPLVTGAGGTTIPFTRTLHDGTVLTVKKERAWGWDYVVEQAAEQGNGATRPLSDYFSVGDGGGVSSFFKLPWYQGYTPGITRTKSGQFFAADFGTGSQVQVILPANFAGRNMPDLSTNADPYSGYQLVQGGLAYTGNGGTSFVAPQLNGVTALFVQALGGRVGQIAPALYQLGNLTTTDIKAGDNWGYTATGGFENAAGVGALDAAKLLTGLAFFKLVR